MLHSFKHLQYDLFVGLLDLPGFSKRRSKSHRRTVGWNFDGYFLVPGFGIFTAAASTVLDGLQVAGFTLFPSIFPIKKKWGCRSCPKKKPPVKPRCHCRGCLGSFGTISFEEKGSSWHSLGSKDLSRQLTICWVVEQFGRISKFGLEVLVTSDGMFNVC